MKIIENTPDRLVIHDTPTLQVFLGLLFSLVGLIVIFVFARSVDVHCEKVETRQVNCQLTQKLGGLLTFGTRSVLNVQKADVAASTDSDGNATYRMIFITATGKTPLTFYYSSGFNSKTSQAQRINTFIQNAAQPTLDFQVSMDWWTWFFLIVFGGLGGFMIVVAKTVHIEMVRSEGVLRITKRGLFGSGQEEHTLREIDSVALESSFGSRGTPTYRIAFNIADGGKRLLSRMYTSGRKDKPQAVEAMNAFLAPYRSSV